MKVKTIDVNAKEWFDKINGNSYCAGTVIINFGMKNQKNHVFPFQYGYGSYYEQAALEVIEKNYPELIREKSYRATLWTICDKNNIIYRHSIIKNCKKKELMEISE